MSWLWCTGSAAAGCWTAGRSPSPLESLCSSLWDQHQRPAERRRRRRRSQFALTHVSDWWDEKLSALSFVFTITCWPVRSWWREPGRRTCPLASWRCECIWRARWRTLQRSPTWSEPRSQSRDTCSQGALEQHRKDTHVNFYMFGWFIRKEAVFHAPFTRSHVVSF